MVRSTCSLHLQLVTTTDLEVAIGYQYNELARILLSVHDPGLPTVGPLRRRVVQEADVSCAEDSK